MLANKLANKPIFMVATSDFVSNVKLTIAREHSQNRVSDHLLYLHLVSDQGRSCVKAYTKALNSY